MLEILKKEEDAAAFDRFRKLRNGINYYGKRVLPQDASLICSEMKGLIKKCKLLLLEKIT